MKNAVHKHTVSERIGATQASERFGCSRRTVYARAKRFGLQADPSGKFDAAEIERALTTELRPTRASSGLRAELLKEQCRRLSRECDLIEARLAREQAKYVAMPEALQTFETEARRWHRAAHDTTSQIKVAQRVESAPWVPAFLRCGHAVEPYLARLETGMAGALENATQEATEGLSI